MPDGYGLPSPRDDEGNLKPVDHEFEFDGREVRIQLIPPTINQFEEYETLGEEISMEKVRGIIDRHIEKPTVDAGEITMYELQCYFAGILDYATTGGSSELMETVRDELDRRQEEAAGN